ncbi:MAG: hypothetical protein ACI4R7_01700 [Oliverpabstia sp.]
MSEEKKKQIQNMADFELDDKELEAVTGGERRSYSKDGCAANVRDEGECCLMALPEGCGTNDACWAAWNIYSE